MLVPFGDIVLPLFVAFSRWPALEKKLKEELYASILDYKAAEIDIEAWGDELNNFAKSENDEALVLSVVKHILEADRRDPQFQRLMLQAALSRHPLSKITAQRLLPLQRFLGY